MLTFSYFKGYTQAEEETMERAKRIYRDELINGIERQKQIRDEEKSYLRLPVSFAFIC